MIPIINIYYFLYFIIIFLFFFLVIIIFKDSSEIEKKIGKLLVLWASIAIIVSTFIFILYASKIVYKDLFQSSTIIDE